MNRQLPSTTIASASAALMPAAHAEPPATEQAAGPASDRIHVIERVGRTAWRLPHRKTSITQSGLGP
jgi:hypothetical protein